MDDSIDWNGICCFLAVARTGRLSGAAKRLGIDVTTVHRRLAHFEASTQFRLFDRGPSGYNLSERGQRMLETAEAIESSILRLRSIVDEVANFARPVRIGAPPEFGDYFLAPRIATLCEKNEILSPQLFVRTEPYSLANREVDISITFDRPTEGRLYVRKLTNFTVGLYASQSYLQSRPPIINIRDLGTHVLIDDIAQESQPSAEQQEILQLDMSRFQTTSFAAKINATRAGSGICMLPDFIAREYSELKRILDPRFSIMRAFWTVVHADMRNDPQVKMAINAIVAEVRAMQAQFVQNERPTKSLAKVLAQHSTGRFEASANLPCFEA